MMPGQTLFADTGRFLHATLSNQIAKVSPTLYARLTKQTGRGFAPESARQAADYFQTCFRDYFDILGVPEDKIPGYLHGKQLLEYGPGDVPGVALLMIAHGAERVTCVDRFELVSMSQKNADILLELLWRLDNSARARAAECFRQPGDPYSGFNPARIRYLIHPDGLSQLAGEIDLLLSRAVLEHVNDLDATFDDMARALKPDGILLHQVDLKSHGLHRRNPLDFLSWPPALWSWMHSHKGVPNRWRVNRYRDAMRRIGFDTLLLRPTEVAEAGVVDEVRPHLAGPFKTLSDADLSWLGFWLMGRRAQPMKPIKVLTFSSLYPNAAQPTHGIFVENRLRHLLASGEIEVQVVAPVPWFPLASPLFGKYANYAKVPEQEVKHGIEVWHPRYWVLPKIGMSIAPLLMARAAEKTVRRLRAQGFEFDLIDAHYFYPDGVAACLVADRLGKPCVVTARGTDINLIPRHRLPKRWILWAAKKSRAMISVCQALKNEMAAIGIAADKVTALRNGVDLDFFNPGNREEIRNQLNISGKTLLSVGYLIERKGHHLIIEALPSLPDVRLYIAGEGDMSAQLRRLAAEQGVAERVVFLGTLDREALRRYMVAADALVLASSREGMANVLLEALACGTPVVATPLWGTPEVVAAPEAGVLTRDRSVAGIVDGVQRLFTHYPNREATRRYAEKFGWDDTTQGQLALFRRVLSG